MDVAANWVAGTKLEGYVESIDGDTVEGVFAAECDGPRWRIGFSRSMLPEDRRDDLRLGTYLDARFTGDDLKISLKDVGVVTEGDGSRNRSDDQAMADLAAWFTNDDRAGDGLI